MVSNVLADAESEDRTPPHGEVSWERSQGSILVANSDDPFDDFDEDDFDDDFDDDFEEDWDDDLADDSEFPDTFGDDDGDADEEYDDSPFSDDPDFDED